MQDPLIWGAHQRGPDRPMVRSNPYIIQSLLYHSTQGLRVTKKKKKVVLELIMGSVVLAHVIDSGWEVGKEGSA